MRKARIWRAFLIEERKFSKNKNAWLSWKESDFHLPECKSLGRVRAAFPRLLGKERTIYANSLLLVPRQP